MATAILDKLKNQDKVSRAEFSRSWEAQKSLPPEINLSRFCLLVSKAKSHNQSVARDAASQLEKDFGSSPVEKAALGVETGTIGGYLIPPALSVRLLHPIMEQSIIYPRALIVPMETLTVDCPTVDNTINNTGASPFAGGMVFSWNATGTPSETEPKFRNVQLRAWNLVGYSTMSGQFLTDTGPEGEAALIKLFSRGAAYQADWAFIQGFGASSQLPVGVINSPCAISINRAVSSQVSAADIANMVAALIPSSWDHAVWAVNVSCMAQIVKLSTYFLSGAAPAGDQLVQYLNGLRMFPTDKTPVLGTKGDVTLFDPSLYAVGQRQEVVIDASPHPGFRNAQIDFRLWLRVDGKPLMDNPVTLADGSTTASSVVVLK